jgi:hypothetical protein
MQTFNTDWVPGSETSRILGAVLEERMFERAEKVGGPNKSGNTWIEKVRIKEGDGKLAVYFRDSEGVMRRINRSKEQDAGKSVGHLHKGFGSYMFSDEALGDAEIVFIAG